jgi:hypothetical protein
MHSAGMVAANPRNNENASSLDLDNTDVGNTGSLHAGHSIDDDLGTEGMSNASSNPSFNKTPNNTENSNSSRIPRTPGFQADRDPAGRSNPQMLRDTASRRPFSDEFVLFQGLETDDPQVSQQKADSPQYNTSTARNGDTGSNSGNVAPTAEVEYKLQNWNERDRAINSNQPKSKRVDGKVDGNLNKLSANVDARQIAETTNSVEQLTPLPWQADLEKLIARVEQDLLRSNLDRPSDVQSEYLRRQAHLRLLYLMSQRQEEALTAISGIDPSQQEYWQSLILAMSNSFDTAQFPDSTDRAAQVVAPLSAALRRVRETAPLTIKNMGFCRKISYFGNYERFPRNEFTPGQEVLLYTEIENFVSSTTIDGEYRTLLKSLVEIVDQQGKVVWTKGFPSTEDLCRNPRRDYFHNYQFHIPRDLSTGTYSLKLTIEDELGHKRISNSLNFVLK